MKHALLIALLLVLPFLNLARAEDDVLIDNTKAAQERVDQWDVEAKTIDQRRSWEIPVVSALSFIGFIFYAAGPKAGCITAGVTAVGLSFYFWPYHHTSKEPPRRDKESGLAP